MLISIKMEIQDGNERKYNKKLASDDTEIIVISPNLTIKIVQETDMNKSHVSW